LTVFVEVVEGVVNGAVFGGAMLVGGGEGLGGKFSELDGEWECGLCSCGA